MHQEIGWERRTDDSNVAVLVYADKIDNPVIEAMGSPAVGNSAASPLLYDSASGLVRAAGPGFSSSGLQATVGHKLTGGRMGGSQIRVSCANGSALVLGSSQLGGQAVGQQAMGLAQLLATAHARHAQSYSISLSGTLDGSGTRWRATYRWQPEATITSVASFSQDAADPYLNLQLRQPVRIRRNGSDGVGGFEVIVNLRNLLAEGYQPYLLSDGSLLVFAQDQRSFSGGLAFNF